MTGLPGFQLNEPVITAMTALLTASLPANITALNATVTDGYTVPAVAQFLPFTPIASFLEGGMPVVAVGDMPAAFENDTQFRIDATHQFMVTAIAQNADHQTLVWQLRRLTQAIAYTIQQDRLQGTVQGTGGTMRDQAGTWAVNYLRTEPGPLLAEYPDSLDGQPPGPPKSYLSWTGLVLAGTRSEV